MFFSCTLLFYFFWFETWKLRWRGQYKRQTNIYYIYTIRKRSLKQTDKYFYKFISIQFNIKRNTSFIVKKTSKRGRSMDQISTTAKWRTKPEHLTQKSSDLDFIYWKPIRKVSFGSIWVGTPAEMSRLYTSISGFCLSLLCLTVDGGGGRRRGVWPLVLFEVADPKSKPRVDPSRE